MNAARRILIVGIEPPPYGGISVFVKRYRARLRREGCLVDLLEYGKLGRRDQIRAVLAIDPEQYDEIHVHEFAPQLALLFLWRGLVRNTRYTIHGSLGVESWTGWRFWLFTQFTRRCRELVAVGPHVLEICRERGVRLPEQVSVKDAFLPPDESEEAAILAGYPEAVLRFVETHRPLVIANAFSLVQFEGIDLYGLDMCVELMRALREQFPECGLLFALPKEGDGAYLADIRRRIAGHGLGETIMLSTGQRELWPLFRRADLFVRPTFRDGRGISIDEALYFGCPAVASDACRRAEGTVLFINRDQEDFNRACLSVLNKLTVSRS